MNYQVSNILLEKGTGSIYFGQENDTAAKVIIKEARKYVYSTGYKLETELRNNEFEIAQELYSNDIKVAAPLNVIDEQYATFYVYKFIEGKSLWNYAATRGIFVSKDNAIQKMNDVITNIFNILTRIHKLNYANVDIHPRNFIVNDSGIYLIDLENIRTYEDYSQDKFEVQTYGYWLPQFEQDNYFNKDYRRLGMLCLHMIGNLNFFAAQTNNLEKALTMLSRWLLKSNMNLRTTKLVNYLLTSDDIQESQFIRYTEEFNNQEFKLNDLIPDDIQNIDIDNLDEDSLQVLNTGLTGIGGILMTHTDLTERVCLLIGAEIQSRMTYVNNVPMTTKHNASKVVSPYLADGMSGFILGLIFQQSKYVTYFKDSLAIEISKSPALFNSLTGIALTNYVMSKSLSREKNYDHSLHQIDNAIDYLSLQDGKVTLQRSFERDFSTGFETGVEGLEYVANLIEQDYSYEKLYKIIFQ